MYMVGLSKLVAWMCKALYMQQTKILFYYIGENQAWCSYPVDSWIALELWTIMNIVNQYKNKTTKHILMGAIVYGNGNQLDVTQSNNKFTINYLSHSR